MLASSRATYVDGDGSEEDAEEGAENEGAWSEFGAGDGGRDEGLEVGGDCHVDEGTPAELALWDWRGVYQVFAARTGAEMAVPGGVISVPIG